VLGTLGGRARHAGKYSPQTTHGATAGVDRVSAPGHRNSGGADLPEELHCHAPNALSFHPDNRGRARYRRIGPNVPIAVDSVGDDPALGPRGPIDRPVWVG
jgi:hypothetical protein